MAIPLSSILSTTILYRAIMLLLTRGFEGRVQGAKVTWEASVRCHTYQGIRNIPGSESPMTRRGRNKSRRQKPVAYFYKSEFCSQY